MIYVTGDVHGDLSRFKNNSLRRLRDTDVVLVCGDFGFIWDGSRKEMSNLKKLSSLPFTIAFVDGCHENFDLLEQYPIEEWNGGKIHRISENIVHMMRGQVFYIQGKKIFTFGGGQSQDADIRRDANTWWQHEIPSIAEIAEGVENLRKCNNEVDYIITHEPPLAIHNSFDFDFNLKLEFHTFFESISERCWFRTWYFGKFHTNKSVMQKYCALFDYIIAIDTDGSYDDDI